MNPIRVVIVGGGFGGIRTALDVASKNTDITVALISDKTHFEYHPALYKVVTGSSPLEVCIPLNDIFGNTNVEVVHDQITGVDTQNKILIGKSGSRFRFDYCVLALGSETAYHSIPHLDTYSFGCKSINEAVRLNRHVHTLFDVCHAQSKAEKECSLRFVVAGGGATGVELAAQLAQYTKQCARAHHDLSVHIIIDLIEASARILSQLPKHISTVITQRLKQLGVTILVNRPIVRDEIETVYLRDMKLKTKTLIWTAGVTLNHLYTQIPRIVIGKDGYVSVNEFLQATDDGSIFVIGDGASSIYHGMAQTALDQGKIVADNIIRVVRHKNMRPYTPRKPVYAIPVGSRYAVAYCRGITLYGIYGWIVRQLADLRFFVSILPFWKAITVFRSGYSLSETCPQCKYYISHKEENE